jgi:hypothetical protein
MAFDVNLTITGLQEAQAANNRRIAALKPTGALGRAVQYGTVEAQRYAVIDTHVDTGTLRASHRMEVMGVRGRVYIDPGAANSRTGKHAAEYGPYEHARGGSLAFYQLVIDQHGSTIVGAMMRLVAAGVKAA